MCIRGIRGWENTQAQGSKAGNLRTHHNQHRHRDQRQHQVSRSTGPHACARRTTGCVVSQLRPTCAFEQHAGLEWRAASLRRHLQDRGFQTIATRASPDRHRHQEQSHCGVVVQVRIPPPFRGCGGSWSARHHCRTHRYPQRVSCRCCGHHSHHHLLVPTGSLLSLGKLLMLLPLVTSQLLSGCRRRRCRGLIWPPLWWQTIRSQTHVAGRYRHTGPLWRPQRGRRTRKTGVGRRQ